jgi:hypothetical protein
MKPIGSNSLTSSPRDGFAVIAGGAQQSAAKLGVSKDGSLKAIVRGRPSRRIAFAMLLRMRVGEDADMIRTSETFH